MFRLGNKAKNGLAVLFTCVVLGLSGLVLVAWMAGWHGIIQPVLGGAIMQYNTAVCLAALALAGLFLCRNLRRLAILACLPPIALGLLTLAEYGFSLDLGIDEFLAKAYIVHPTNPPGRMAFNTAMCVTACGAAIILISRFSQHYRAAVVARLLSMAVLVMSVCVLVAHLFSLPPLYGWYGLTHMAPHTALNFTLLGAALPLLGGALDVSGGQRQSVNWLVFFVGGLIVTVALWQSLLALSVPDFSNAERYSVVGLSAVLLVLGLVASFALSASLYQWNQALALAAKHETACDALSREAAARAEAQQELSAREEHVRALLESAGEGIYGIDLDGICTFCNTACLRMLGYERADDLLGKELHGLIHHSRPNGHSYARETCPILQAMDQADGLRVDTESFWRADGTRFPVEYRAQPVMRSGEVRGAVISFVDITDRKAAERALRESEERLDLAVRGANDGLWDWDIASNTTWYSDRYRALLDYHREADFPGQFDSFVNAIHPDDRADTLAAIQRHIDDYAPCNVECRLRTSDGTYRWFQVRGDCIRGADGSAARMAGSIQDVTERHQLLEELEQLNASLVERTRDLEHRNQEVEAFVYIVSHDLRAPLVNIQGFCRELGHSCDDLMELAKALELAPGKARRLRSIVKEDIPGALHYIEAGTTKFERLIDALLRLSRIGRQEYQLEDLDMVALAETTVDSLRKIIEAEGATVQVEDLPAAIGDRTAVGQIFGNLVGNALNYLRPETPGRIVVGSMTSECEDEHCYFVRDNGAGIPPGGRDRVFRVFQRLHPGRCEGEGMGLAIVKRIVERHGGRIWLESEVGAGTTVFFSLPAADRARAASIEQEFAHHGG